ncbi:MAG TPA: diguanylate cyclase [Gaiellaceae bacterium]|jgi:diguanylate cyclase (GGDEF)-like protein|nr:diguanylate cyclase [Gaiellaceae bacterium]
MRLAGEETERQADDVRLRAASARAYAVLQERDPVRQEARIAADLLELLVADSVQCFELRADEISPGDCYGRPLPRLALAMQQELLQLGLRSERSLLSSRRARVTTELLVARAHGETLGAFAVHWLGRDRPGQEVRGGFDHYWDLIGFALAATEERTRLQQVAYVDPLTGLPNSQALERELSSHALTQPLSVLALDFDGLKQANTAHGFVLGGDLLIRTVGRALDALRRPGEFVARMYTAGDEFAVLLPGLEEAAAARRAAELEADLDQVAVPETLVGVYRGASVGYASRRQGETPGQVLGRAGDRIRARKLARGRRRSDT